MLTRCSLLREYHVSCRMARPVMGRLVSSHPGGVEVTTPLPPMSQHKPYQKYWPTSSPQSRTMGKPLAGSRRAPVPRPGLSPRRGKTNLITQPPISDRHVRHPRPSRWELHCKRAWGSNLSVSRIETNLGNLGSYSFSRHPSMACPTFVRYQPSQARKRETRRGGCVQVRLCVVGRLGGCPSLIHDSSPPLPPWGCDVCHA
ncbi:hypothetical protein B0I35DRAFT_257685 [Stachybotrys elegans]|uniref:Uncharacterized protein n=1 Tax=Stachybotrys elegans TaxID=80388 RepID=A0A8K0WPU0_9HYPO|nr:hypothetical protein B0I35DRAFT_257685 [Stachybotrys elegans]